MKIKKFIIPIVLISTFFYMGNTMCQKADDNYRQYVHSLEEKYSTNSTSSTKWEREYDEFNRKINNFKRILDENYTLEYHNMSKTQEYFDYVSTDKKITIRQIWKGYLKFDKTIITIEENGEIQEYTINIKIF